MTHFGSLAQIKQQFGVNFIYIIGKFGVSYTTKAYINNFVTIHNLMKSASFHSITYM